MVPRGRFEGHEATGKRHADGHGAGGNGLCAGLAGCREHADTSGRGRRHGAPRPGFLHLRRGRQGADTASPSSPPPRPAYRRPTVSLPSPSRCGRSSGRRRHQPTSSFWMFMWPSILPTSAPTARSSPPARRCRSSWWTTPSTSRRDALRGAVLGAGVTPGVGAPQARRHGVRLGRTVRGHGDHHRRRRAPAGVGLVSNIGQASNDDKTTGSKLSQRFTIGSNANASSYTLTGVDVVSGGVAGSRRKCARPTPAGIPRRPVRISSRRAPLRPERCPSPPGAYHPRERRDLLGGDGFCRHFSVQPHALGCPGYGARPRLEHCGQLRGPSTLSPTTHGPQTVTAMRFALPSRALRGAATPSTDAELSGCRWARG